MPEQKKPSDYLASIATLRQDLDTEFQREISKRLSRGVDPQLTFSSSLTNELKNIRKLAPGGWWSEKYRKEILLSQFLVGPFLLPFLGRAVSSLLKDYSKGVPCSFKEVKVLWEKIAHSIPSLRTHSFRHFLHHPKYLFGTIQCRNIFHILLGQAFPFDPKAELGNLSGILWVEDLSRTKKEGSVFNSLLWNIGPTPTVGNQLSLECQCFARLVSTSGIDLGRHLIKGWVYINLQNRLDSNERSRSLVIEELAVKYKENIAVASISVDSPHYRVTYDVAQISLEEAKEQLLAFLKDPSIFEPQSKSWYFFSLCEREDQEKWVEVSSFVIASAYGFVVSLLSEVADYEKHKIFQELVVWGLCRAWQGWSSSYLSECAIDLPREQEKELSLLSTITCREGVDRGGAINGGLISLLSEDSMEKVVEKALSIMWGRPILFRGRLNELERSEGFFLAIEYVRTLQLLRQFLNETYQKGQNSFHQALILKS